MAEQSLLPAEPKATMEETAVAVAVSSIEPGSTQEPAKASTMEATAPEPNRVDDNEESHSSDKNSSSSSSEDDEELLQRVENLMTPETTKKEDDESQTTDSASKSNNKWSFSSLWSAKHKNKAEAATEAATEEADLVRTDSLMDDNSNPQWVSITVVVQQQDIDDETFQNLPLATEHDEETGTSSVRLARFDKNDEASIFYGTCVQAGDILQSVNAEKCTHHDAVLQTLADRAVVGEPLTLTMECPHGNPVLAQAIVLKPTPDTKLGVELLNVSVHDKPSSESQQSQQSQQQRSSTHNNSTTMLQIKQFDAKGLLAASALHPGDWILRINDREENVTQMPAQDAAQLILDEPRRVSIVTMKPPDLKDVDTRTTAQKWLRHAKRAGIAIGGGTMVGVGLIFIPTLPPPFGEVLIAGGVSVLGTEFEGPKRVVRSARDSLERAVGRTVEEEEDANDNTINAAANENDNANDGSVDQSQERTAEAEAESSVAGEEFQDKTKEPESSADAQEGDVNVDNPPSNSTASTTSTQEQQPKKKTMGDRFKSFGRNVVLPFLDQVVGDRKEEEPKTPDEIQKSNTERTASLEQDEQEEANGTIIEDGNPPGEETTDGPRMLAT
mmetsp:Transcript_7994/g.22224  ORF Transcript_7994/g.22224 Transcript_7994/m.22224 type:complete len:614 (+) Transcript_7994:42-1883(+)